MDSTDRSNRLSAIILVCLIPVILLIGFRDKAVHVDDTLFVLTARHILENPLDFYGFTINWYGTEMPMHRVLQNPPLASYFLALPGMVFGFQETALHLFYLIPVLLCALGMLALARELCPHPLVAALIGILTPAFLVAGAGLMSDIPMLCFWVWALVLWIRGMNSGRHGPLLAAAVIMSLGMLTKYYALSLLPLLLCYSLALRKRIGVWILYFLIPLAVLALYHVLTVQLYGQGHLGGAIGYALRENPTWQGVLRQALLGLAFTGGCLLPVLFFFPLTQSRRGLLVWALAGLAVVAGLYLTGAIHLIENKEKTGLESYMLPQATLFITVGILVPALAAAELVRKPDAGSLLLFLSIIGPFIFASYLNWSVNGRSILPMTLVVGVLLARRLAWRFETAGTALKPALVLALILSAGLSLAVTWADYTWAGSARAFAFRLAEKAKHEPGRLWFNGHWGFQYYMERQGFAHVDIHRSRLKKGDRVVIATNNTAAAFPLTPFAFQEKISVRASRFISLKHPALLSGFYSSANGPLPYILVDHADDDYWIFTAKSNLSFKLRPSSDQKGPRRYPVAPRPRTDYDEPGS